MATRSETVKLRLTSEELELYKGRAGVFGMDLSSWIRSRCDSEVEAAWTEHNQSIDGLALVGNAIGKLPAKRTGICPHRRRPDEYCVKCD